MPMRSSNLKRLGRVVAAVERRRVYRGVVMRPRFLGPTNAVLTGVVSTTITARSGTTLGSGVVTLCKTDPDAGTEATTGDTITVYNSFGYAFAANASKRCKIHWEGVWKILNREC